MSNQDNKVAFISGANRGISFETAKKLGELGVKVILGARDVTKGKVAASDSTSANIKYAYLDKQG